MELGIYTVDEASLEHAVEENRWVDEEGKPIGYQIMTHYWTLYNMKLIFQIEILKS